MRTDVRIDRQTDRQTDRQEEANSRFSHFAKSPKNEHSILLISMSRFASQHMLTILGCGTMKPNSLTVRKCDNTF